MSISYVDLEMLFTWVWMGDMGYSQAWVHRHDGRGYCCSDFDPSVNEPPPDDLDSGDWLEIPDKRALDLGSHLVFAFAAEHLKPDQQDHVQTIFRRKGAYRAFRDFLNYLGRLDDWHAFENTHEEAAIRSWAKEQGLIIREMN